MDFELLRAGLQDAVPLNQHLGLEVLEVGEGRGVVLLPDDGRLRNHVGSQHASALFAAGHAASGVALASAFAERLRTLTPLPEGAGIGYRQIARGPITATAVLGATPGELLAELDGEGEVRCTVDVALTNGPGDVVGDMTVRWLVRTDDEQR